MQVWNVLHAARWKYRMQKSRQKFAIWAPLHDFVGYIFATMARIDNRKKKLVKQQWVLHMSPQYGELQPTSGWDRFTSLGHPSRFQRPSHLGSVTAQRQPNFAVLNRRHHLCSAGRPSRWALAHISSCYCWAAHRMPLISISMASICMTRPRTQN